RDVVGNQGAGTNHRAFPDFDAAHDDRSAPDRGSAPNQGWLKQPVLFGLRCAVRIGGAGTTIVDEDHIVPDEHFVLDGYSGAYEGMARDFASLADPSVALNFHECANPRVVTDLTPIQVDKLA